jgi:hypothetical protein
MPGRLTAGVRAVALTAAASRKRCRLTTGVLTLSLTLAGCAAQRPVSPLPTEAAASRAVPPTAVSTGPAAASRATSAGTPALPTAAAPVSRRPAGSPRPPRTSTPPRPPATPSCEGAVVHTIDVAADELALIPSLCVAVGAVLRLENIGPGEVTTDAPRLVDQHYEAGVVEIRFVRAGTVVVTIPQQDDVHDITVVVR